MGDRASEKKQEPHLGRALASRALLHGRMSGLPGSYNPGTSPLPTPFPRSSEATT